MPDASATPPAGAPVTPPEGDEPAAAAAAATPPAGNPELDRLNKELAETRREAAGYRTKLKTFEDAQKTDTEKTAERIKELETQNASLLAAQRASTVRSSAVAAASR